MNAYVLCLFLLVGCGPNAANTPATAEPAPVAPAAPVTPAEPIAPAEPVAPAPPAPPPAAPTSPPPVVESPCDPFQIHVEWYARPSLEHFRFDVSRDGAFEIEYPERLEPNDIRTFTGPPYVVARGTLTPEQRSTLAREIVDLGIACCPRQLRSPGLHGLNVVIEGTCGARRFETTGSNCFPSQFGGVIDALYRVAPTDLPPEARMPSPESEPGRSCPSTCAACAH